MLEDSIEDLTKIAADPSTASHLLIELGKHENSQIRSLVASNPNTPLDTLKSLGIEFADTIVDNPAFDLLKLENPHSKFVQLIIASSTKTLPEVLAKLIATENLDGEICRAVAKNINTPIDALASLAITIIKEKDAYVIVFGSNAVSGWFSLALDIIRHSDFTESYLEKIIDICIERNHEYLLFRIVKLPELSFSMLEKLSTYQVIDPDSQFKEYGYGYQLMNFSHVKNSPVLLDNVARNTLVSARDIRYTEEVFLKIANNPLTSSSTIEYLAAHHSPEIRNALESHPNISPKALDIFLFTQIKLGTPIEILHEIAEDPRFYSAMLMCQYPNVPSEVIEKVGNYLPDYRRNKHYRLTVLQCLAYHPNTPLNLLQKIADELQQVSTSVANGERYYQRGFINSNLLKDIDELAEKISKRLEGENLVETEQLSAYWSLFESTQSESSKKITEKMKSKQGRYSWANFSLPDPNAKN